MNKTFSVSAKYYWHSQFGYVLSGVRKSFLVKAPTAAKAKDYVVQKFSTIDDEMLAVDTIEVEEVVVYDASSIAQS